MNKTTITQSRFQKLEIESPAAQTVSFVPPAGTMPVDSFLAAVTDRSALDRDVDITRREIVITADPITNRMVASPGQFGLVQNAIPSLCEKLDIPKPVGRWLSEHHATELAGIFNERLPVSNGDFTMRLCQEPGGDECVRFFASKAYSPFDHKQAVQAVSDSGCGGGVLGAELSLDRMRLTGNLKAKVLFGESDAGYKFGALVANSEVGTGSTIVRPFLYRNYCQNGMVFGLRYGYATIRANHRYGIDHETLVKEISAIVEIASQGFPSTIEALESLKGLPTKANHRKLVASICKSQGLSVAVFNGWLESINSEPGDTAFHVLQGLTAYAKGIEDEQRQFDIERIAGDIATGGVMVDDPRVVMRLWTDYGKRAESQSEDSLRVYLRA